MPQPTLDHVLTEIRALGEETRLRIVIALARGEMTVSELTHILQQSQPRVSRHVKILAEAGLVEGNREGAWVFYRLNPDAGVIAGMEDMLLALGTAQEEVLRDDAARLAEVNAARSEVAAQFFQRNADSWDRLRRLHLPESDIEAKLLEIVGPEKVGLFADLGTGTGRMLIVFRDLYEQAVGYDVSREMLSVARTALADAGVEGVHVRQADLFDLGEGAPKADLVCIHQVLHYLADPAAAVRAARTMLKPGGRIVIVDFAPHGLEFLRQDFAHRKLGFDDDDARRWAELEGLSLTRTETLRPRADEKDRLTVKLWLLQDDTAPAAQHTDQREVLNV